MRRVPPGLAWVAAAPVVATGAAVAAGALGGVVGALGTVGAAAGEGAAGAHAAARVAPAISVSDRSAARRLTRISCGLMLIPPWIRGRTCPLRRVRREVNYGMRGNKGCQLQRGGPRGSAP